MPKPSFFIKEQTGFILPYVLFVSAFILILLTASIHMYRNEVHMTAIELEQIKAETLFQMGYASYIDHLDGTPPSEVDYVFPHGTVHIRLNETTNTINVRIQTKDQIRRTFTSPLPEEMTVLSP